MLTNVLNYHAGSGEIKPDSLHKAFCERVMSSGDTMRESFKRLDVDKSGSLDKQEIKRVFQAHNILYSDEEFDALYQHQQGWPLLLFRICENVTSLAREEIIHVVGVWVGDP
jgi:hypothetical protein